MEGEWNGRRTGLWHLSLIPRLKLNANEICVGEDGGSRHLEGKKGEEGEGGLGEKDERKEGNWSG